MAKRYPDSYLGKSAAKRAEEIKDHKIQIRAFYDSLMEAHGKSVGRGSAACRRHARLNPARIRRCPITRRRSIQERCRHRAAAPAEKPASPPSGAGKTAEAQGPVIA